MKVDLVEDLKASFDHYFVNYLCFECFWPSVKIGKSCVRVFKSSGG